MKKNIKLLNESIEHWYQNLDMLILNNLSDDYLYKDININSCDCPLCQNYYCDMCPIGIDTANGCGSTPWIRVSYWISYWISEDGGYTEGYKVISEEIEYLINLRDKLLGS
jgi:hypothetical protein